MGVRLQFFKNVESITVGGSELIEFLKKHDVDWEEKYEMHVPFKLLRQAEAEGLLWEGAFEEIEQKKYEDNDIVFLDEC